MSKALIHVFNGTMIQPVKNRVKSDDSQVCSLRFDLFHAGFELCLNLVYLCLQSSFNSPMFQGVKFRVEGDDSQVCSLRFDLFHEGF